MSGPEPRCMPSVSPAWLLSPGPLLTLLKGSLMALRPRFLLSVMAVVTAFAGAATLQAAPIVIDDFTAVQTASGSGDEESFGTTLFSNSLAASFGPFTGRGVNSQYFQVGAVPLRTYTASATIGSGSGTLVHGRNTGSNASASGLSTGLAYTSSTPIDLTGGGTNEQIRITLSSQVTGPAAAPFFRVDSEQATYFIFPSAGIFPTTTSPLTTYTIPFSAFRDFGNESPPAGFFTGITQMAFFFESGTEPDPYSASYSFSNISAVPVPEPGTLAMLAGAAGVIAAGLIRRRRFAAKTKG